MTLVSLPDFSGTMRPNVVDDTRFTRRSVITALEARLFHTANERGLIELTYMALDNCNYLTRFRLTALGIQCPTCGELCDELTHHPGDRGLCCPDCVKRLANVARTQAKRRPAKRRTGAIQRMRRKMTRSAV